MMTAWKKFCRAVAVFREARAGNVAIIFAIAGIPVMSFVGTAYDYSHANAVKAALQAALDSTALMLSKDTAGLSDGADMSTKATTYFTALFTPHTPVNGININSVTATYHSTNGSSVLVDAYVDVPTSFLAFVGQSTITVHGTSSSAWGSNRLRVALVLDNTGSMADAGKMGALQSATKSLLTQLQNAASTNGDVYVSIIPFVKDVNLDPVNYKASWIDWTDWNAQNGTCSKSKQKTQSSCLSKGGLWIPKNHNTWNGCVVDRGGSSAPSILNTDTNVTAPLPLVTDTLYSAEQYSSCPQAVMGLSYNWSAMTSLINAMSPAGNTNQAIGLQLGWVSLVGGGPFSVPALQSGYNYSQIIILLTDGLNTQDRWYTSQNSIDARQQMTCDNIKAAGITLYTIQVNTGGDPTSTLLQNCASTSDKFYLLTSASQIITAFTAIGTNLTQLRVAK